MNSDRRVATRGIIYRDGHILVTKFRNSDGSETDHWGTFGGGLDPHESLTDGLYREMIEETGIAPKIGKLLFIQQYTERHDHQKENLEFFFHIENTEDYASIDLSATSHGLLELVRSEFLNPKEHNVRPIFLTDIDVKDHIENHRPVFIYTELRSTER